MRTRLALLLLVLCLGPLMACASEGGGNTTPTTEPDETATTLSPEQALTDFTCPKAAREAGEVRAGPSGGRKLQVITTVAPITSLVGEIAGELADVTGVVPEGVNSHTYEPKPSVAKVMAEADLVLVNGLKLEDPTAEIADENMPAQAQLLELGDLTITDDQYLYDFSFPKSGGKPNPHLWTNPPMARCYAAIAASAMAKADPDNADGYRRNFDALATRIDDLDKRMAAASKGMTTRQKKLLTYHDAYAYFAVRYDWTVLGAIQVSNFEDPTPKEIAGLIEQVNEERVPAIFGSEVFPSTVLEQIGDETGVRYVDTLRDDDLPGEPGDPEHSYLGLMKFDFVTMVDALGGDASGLRAFAPGDPSVDKASYPQ